MHQRHSLYYAKLTGLGGVQRVRVLGAIGDPHRKGRQQEGLACEETITAAIASGLE